MPVLSISVGSSSKPRVPTNTPPIVPDKSRTTIAARQGAALHSRTPCDTTWTTWSAVRPSGSGGGRFGLHVCDTISGADKGLEVCRSLAVPHLSRDIPGELFATLGRSGIDATEGAREGWRTAIGRRGGCGGGDH